MNISTKISRDRFAKKLGRALLGYFESDQFPMDILQNEQIDLLYESMQYYVIDHDKTLDSMEQVYRMLAVRKEHVARHPFTK